MPVRERKPVKRPVGRTEGEGGGKGLGGLEKQLRKLGAPLTQAAGVVSFAYACHWQMNVVKVRGLMSGRVLRQVIITMEAGATRAGPQPRQDGRSAEVPHLPQHAPPGLRRLSEVPFFIQHSPPLLGNKLSVLVVLCYKLNVST